MDEETIQNLIDGMPVVVVYFWATWCKPCATYGPVVEDVTGRVQAPMFKVDFDDAPILGYKYGITSLPSILVLSSGTELTRITGARDAGTLEDFLRGALQRAPSI